MAKDYPTKYNYDAAIKLVVEASKTDGKVTYKQLEEAFGLEKPITDKDATSTNMSALYELRQALKAKHGLTFKSAATAGKSGPEYQYYVVSKIKDTTITKNKSEKKEKSSTTDKVDYEAQMSYKALKESYDALKKNDLTLYNENLELRRKNEELRSAIIDLNGQMNRYKDTVRSLLDTTDSLAALIDLKHQF